MNCPEDCKQEQVDLKVECFESSGAVKVNKHTSYTCHIKWGGEEYIKSRLYSSEGNALCEHNLKIGGVNGES